MIKFIKLTRSVDHEEIYVNPKYISAIFPYYSDPKKTIVKIVGDGIHCFEVNESVKEIKEKIEKQKNKVKKVKEETKSLADLLSKYPYDPSKVNDSCDPYPMTSLYAAPGLFDSHTNTSRNIEDISSTTITMSKEEDKKEE